MTLREQEDKLNELYGFIADKVVSIRTQVGTGLKNPEDKQKTLMTLTKITDEINLIRQTYQQIETVLYADIDDDPEDDYLGKYNL